jgi:hypothetical protein
MEPTPYIAKIVDFYETGNGNYFCREENKQDGDHHLEWEIFVPKDVASKITHVPFWGIIVTDHNSQFFNGKTRSTCRVLSYDRNELVKIFEEEDSLENEIQQSIETYKVSLDIYYTKSKKCEKALMELKSDISVPVWLLNNKNLFHEVTIRPEGLPIIADATFNGNSFEGIRKFVSLYCDLKKVIE